MSTTNVNEIDKFRNPNETRKESQLKSMFSEKFKNIFDEDRLICLAQCYINIETLGCRYSNDLMKQIKELTSDFKINQSSRSSELTSFESKKQGSAISKTQNNQQTSTKQTSSKTTNQNRYSKESQSPKQSNNNHSKHFTDYPPKSNYFSPHKSKVMAPIQINTKPISKITSSSTLACPTLTTEQSPAPSLVPIPTGLATPFSFTSSCVNKLDFNNESINNDLKLNSKLDEEEEIQQNNIFHLNTMLRSLLLSNNNKTESNDISNDNDDENDEDDIEISFSKKQQIKEAIPNFSIFLSGNDSATLVHERNAISILVNSCNKSSYSLEFELKIKGQKLTIKMHPENSEDENETTSELSAIKKYKCKCLINNFKISSAHGKTKIECKRSAAMKAITRLNRIFPVLQDKSYEISSNHQDQFMSLPSNPQQQRYFKISKEDLFKGLVPPTLFETLSHSASNFGTN